MLNPISGDNKRKPIHRWVNWIAGFSSDFVGDILDRYRAEGVIRPNGVVMDPFAGVGTTLIEAQRRGLASVGFELNPFPFLVSRAKLEASTVRVDELRRTISAFTTALSEFEIRVDRTESVEGIKTRTQLPPGFRSKIAFFSPKVEKKVLASLDFVADIADESIRDLFRVAFASSLVGLSNYSYEPSLTSRPAGGKSLIENIAVSQILAGKLWQIADDIEAYRDELGLLAAKPQHEIHLGSFFLKAKQVGDSSVDIVITSPPYLNNYHYVRNTRPHLFWLNYVTSSTELKQYETQNFGQFWQNVRQAGQIDLSFVNAEISERLSLLRNANPQKGVYGGSGWANYAAVYYNDCQRMLNEFKRLLRPGGVAIVVVGNNVLQGMEFPVDEDIASMARAVGLSAHSEMVRKTRVGSSIMGTGLRHKVSGTLQLYEAAVVIEKN